jgi:hypothetical protein
LTEHQQQLADYVQQGPETTKMLDQQHEEWKGFNMMLGYIQEASLVSSRNDKQASSPSLNLK